MEATLFWIACGLLVYGLILRKLLASAGFLQKRVIMILMHVLFLSAVGALLGFVLSASMDIHGPSPVWPIFGAAICLIGGIIQTSLRGLHTQGTTQLLTEDLEWVETSYSAILLAAVIMYAVVQAFKIPSGSMENTLLVGDHLFVNKFIYGVRVPFTDKRVLKFRDVHRGDVVVFQAPDAATFSPADPEHNVHKDFIKRAIGLPGDEIEIKSKHVYVNGQLSNEPYAVFKDSNIYPVVPLGLPMGDYQKYWSSGRFALQLIQRSEIGDNFGPIRVPEGCYFVMGDNRDNSFDGRFWGPLPNRLLKGKAWVIYWPLNRIRIIR